MKSPLPLSHYFINSNGGMVLNATGKQALLARSGFTFEWREDENHCTLIAFGPWVPGRLCGYPTTAERTLITTINRSDIKSTVGKRYPAPYMRAMAIHRIFAQARKEHLVPSPFEVDTDDTIEPGKEQSK